MLFALLREACACPLFIAIAYWFEGRHGLVPRMGWEQLQWFILAGTALFSNQLFYITGVKLANGTTDR